MRNPLDGFGEGYRLEPLCTKKYVVLLPPGHALAERNGITLQDLSEQPHVDPVRLEDDPHGIACLDPIDDGVRFTVTGNSEPVAASIRGMIVAHAAVMNGTGALTVWRCAGRRRGCTGSAGTAGRHGQAEGSRLHRRDDEGDASPRASPDDCSRGAPALTLFAAVWEVRYFEAAPA